MLQLLCVSILLVGSAFPVPGGAGSVNPIRNCVNYQSLDSNFPIVNFTIPDNTTEIWFQNETFHSLQNLDVRLELICEASYPIQWIETYNKDSDGLGGVKKQDLEKDLWNEVVKMDGAWLYKSVLKVRYQSSICEASNFSCQSTSNPCLQSNVIMELEKTTDIVNIQTIHQPPLIIDDLNFDESGECKAIVSYGMEPTQKYYGFKCEIQPSGKGISERNEYLICDSAAHCNTFYKHQRRGKKCLRKVKDCLYNCAYMKTETYKPGFINCRDNGVLLAQHYFFSVPQTLNGTPEIYFDWSEADPQKMLLLEPITNDTYIGDTITVFCQVSRYYFQYGHLFALEFENGTIQYENVGDGGYAEAYNTNRMNISITLADMELKRVYCLAPIWNDTKWVNQSAEIIVLDDPEPPRFTMSLRSDNGKETFIWYVDEINKTISCGGAGKPPPTLTWIEVVEGAQFTEVFMDKGLIRLEFPLITENIEGTYICEAENFMGLFRKEFRVIVIDRVKLGVKTALIISAAILLLCIVLMHFCWRKIKQQRKQIRLLTEAEIKEFIEGNLDAVHSNDYLDTDELISSLPYNPKFEIPKEMLHIDQSEVLGSGHFGQVLKGSIQLLENQNGKGGKRSLRGMNSIDVAVKTVKHNVEVMYFKTLLSEVKIMAHIGSHPNIVSLVGACTQHIRKREIFIAVEFCRNGSLESFLRKHRTSFINLVKDDVIVPLPPNQHPYENVGEEGGNLTTLSLIKWAREITNGMEFLGSKKIIHGDLATRNVLLADDMVAKIGDFGLSRQLLEYSNYIKNQEGCGLPWKWMAVESLQDMKFSVFSDIWAYGVTIWEVFTLANVPYPGISWSADFLDQLCNGMRMHRPSYATSKIYNIMLDCWNLEPSRRPCFTELKNFFEKLLVDHQPSNYFQPSSFENMNYRPEEMNRNFENLAPVPTSQGTDTGTPLQNLLSPDSGISEDTQGYLVPFLD